MMTHLVKIADRPGEACKKKQKTTRPIRRIIPISWTRKRRIKYEGDLWDDEASQLLQLFTSMYSKINARYRAEQLVVLRNLLYPRKQVGTDFSSS